MSMIAAIMARLGLDTAGYRKDLQSAANATDAAGNRMAGGHKKAADAAEGLWERGKKVERQTEALGRALVKSGSPAEALAASLGTLAETVNLGIFSGLAAAFGVELFGGIVKSREELMALIRAASEFRGFEGLHGANVEMSQLSESLAKARENLVALGKEPGFWEKFGRLFVARDEHIGAGEEQLKGIEAIQGRILEKEKERTKIETLRLWGQEKEAKLLEIQDRFSERRQKSIKAGESPEVQTEIGRQEFIARQAVINEFAEKEKQRLAKANEIQKKAADERKKFQVEAEKSRAEAIEKIREEEEKKSKELKEKGKAFGEGIAKAQAEEAKEKKDKLETAAKKKEASDKAKLEQADRNKMSLGELATEGHGRQRSVARRALRDEERAKDAWARGNEKRALELTERARGLRAGLVGLKDTEKPGAAFGTEMDGTQMAKDIADIRNNYGKNL